MAAKKTKSGAKASRRPSTTAKAGAARRSSRVAKPAKKKSKPSAAEDPAVVRLQRVLDVMASAGAVEVEMEGEGGRLRVRLKEDRPLGPAAGIAPALSAAVPLLDSIPSDSAGSGSAAVDSGLEVFKSPMVGTFYRAASPDAESFVKEGDVVGEDTTLCIIEAMKVMNEIKAEMGGQIVDVLAQNGEPVDYGQPLFTLKS